MTHLTEHEFTDLLDGTLPPTRMHHLDSCAVCRNQADALQDAMSRLSEAEMPEPSPLFWQHFSANVRNALRGYAPARSRWFAGFQKPAMAWGAAGAVAIVILAAAASRSMLPLVHDGGRGGGAIQFPQNAFRSTADVVHAGDDIDADEAWAIVRTVADDFAWEDAQAAGISARPGSAERIALELTAEERIELARLLEEELKRAGA
jgi:hypothetical protein